jgi:hypothetical protein
MLDEEIKKRIDAEVGERSKKLTGESGARQIRVRVLEVGFHDDGKQRFYQVRFSYGEDLIVPVGPSLIGT